MIMYIKYQNDVQFVMIVTRNSSYVTSGAHTEKTSRVKVVMI